MIEQYIYTRMDGGNTKDFGHGIACATPGIVGKLATDVSNISRYYGKTTDAEGNAVRILEKRTLGDGSLFVLQQAVRFSERSAAGDVSPDDTRLRYYSSTNRPQFLTHGLVCDMADEANVTIDPDQWFYQNLVDYNVNLDMPKLSPLERLPVVATPLKSLPDILERMHLSMDTFVSVVRSCFDTCRWDTITLIEMDYTQPDYQELSAQFLRWLYRLLPFGMRQSVNFSTAYDSSCGGRDYSVALVSTTMLTEERNGRITLRIMPSSVRYGYLFAHNRCTHQSISDHTEFDKSGSVYAVWLEEVIRGICGETQECAEQTLETLNDIYRVIDEELHGEDLKTKCHAETMDALIWAYLHNAFPNTAHLTAADSAAESAARQSAAHYFDALLERQDHKLAEKFLHDVLDEAVETTDRRRWGAFLQKAEQALGSNSELEKAKTDLLIHLLDDPDLTQNGAALREEWDIYAKLFPKSASRQLEEAFFPQQGDAASGLARAKVWFDSAVSTGDAKTYLSDIIAISDTLSNFSQEHLKPLVDFLPKPQVSVCSLEQLQEVVEAILGLKTKYKRNDRMKEFYDEVVKSCVSRCKQTLATLNNEPSQLLPVLIQIDDIFRNAKDYSSEKAELMQMAINLWLQEREKERSDKSNAVSLFEDTPELPKRLFDAIQAAKKSHVDPNNLMAVLDCGCAYLCSGQYSSESKKTYAEFPNLGTKFLKPAEPGASVETVCALKDYFGGDLGYKRFERCCKQNERDCLAVLLRLYRNGELPELPPEIAAYSYYLDGMDKNDPNAELAQAFQTILSVKGIKGLVDLLGMYPSAPPKADGKDDGEISAKVKHIVRRLLKADKKHGKRETERPTEYQPREGRFPWMCTDDKLMDALEKGLVGESAVENVVSQEDGEPLLRSILDLCPKDSSLHRRGLVLIDELLRRWKADGFNVNRAKKVLHEEENRTRKKG